MAQGPLPYKIEDERSSCGATALGGLPVYLDLAKVLRIAELVCQHVRARQNKQGWMDAQIVMALVLLQLAGGDCVDDLKILDSDEGFCRILQRVEASLQGLSRVERRRLQLRWRKQKKRSVPSASSVFRFLNAFEIDESGRGPGKSWIPAPPAALQGLYRVNQEVLAGINARAPQTQATLDMDATLKNVFKESAQHSYKGPKAFQPLNVYWAEHDVIVHSEFRDGNVPAGYENLRVLIEALEYLPAGVEKVLFRSDSAAYQWELILYMARGSHPRFGVIDFSVSVDVSEEFRKAAAQVDAQDWKPLLRPIQKEGGRVEWVPSGHEYAEVCFVPSQLSHSKANPELRFVAIRRVLDEADQRRFSGEEGQLALPFSTMKFDKGWYKLHGIVTNRLQMPANELIGWHWARCGKSEEAHAIMKDDLAGGRLPCDGFGQNAAWWAIMILAYNLNSAMKHLVLGEEYKHARLKTMRYRFICLAGRVIEHARQFVIRLSQGHPSLDVLIKARRRLLMLAGAT